MRLSALHSMRLSALFVIVATLAASVVAAQPVPRLLFNLLPKAPTYDMYIPDPVGSGVRFVFFQGETIELDLAIGNTTGAPQRMDTTGVPALGAFRLISRDTPTKTADLLLSTTGHVRQIGRPRPVTWGSAIDLDPGVEMMWHATFKAEGEPGIYRWRIELPQMRTSMPPALNSSLLDYELRACTTFADRAELLRRRMVLADVAEEPSTEQAAKELLAFYPESHEAHRVLGRLYAHAGRKRDARQQFDAAIRLLKDKRDRLYLEHQFRGIDSGDPVAALQSERDDIHSRAQSSRRNHLMSSIRSVASFSPRSMMCRT